MNKRMKMIVSGLLCLMMIGLAGCQLQVGGKNFDDVLTNAVNVKSFEGSGSINLEFSNNGTAKPLKLGEVDLSSLGKIELVITSMKQSEPNVLSVTGKVNMANRSIPFSMQLTKAQLSILIENNPKPIIFKLDSIIGESLQVSGVNISTIFTDPDKLLTMISPFIISKLPDLKNVSVSTSNEKINEESLDLQKIHFELNSAEAITFAKGLLTNMAADPEGINALVTQLYKAFFVTQEVPAGETDFSGMLLSAVSSGLVEQLQKLAADLNSSASTDGTISSLLNDKTSLKTDLYVDTTSQIRKLALDLNLGDTIKASGSMQFWKVNQTVSPDPAINTTSDAFNWEGDSKMAHLLKSFDTSSDTYQLLLNDLHVLNKEIKMNLPPYDKSGKVAEGSAYISKTNRTMVPVRYISEKLDSEVKWDDVKKQVTIIDIITGKTIILTLNSTKATIDGKEVTLDSPATLTNASTYVPIGFIAEALTGAKPDWDPATRTVSISKK
jgi:hypothetical protein